MGKILGSLNSGKDYDELFLDFESMRFIFFKFELIFLKKKKKEAQPSEEEKEIHTTVAAVLDKGPHILDKLYKYDGCEEYIRKVKENYKQFKENF